MRRFPFEAAVRLLLLPLALLCAGATSAHAQEPSFIARVDRTQVPLDDSFIYEVTLSLQRGRFAGYVPPAFKGFKVLGEHPSESTQIQMGGGTMFSQTVYSWRYELQALDKGSFTIGPARAKVDGRELKTDTVQVSIGAPLGAHRAPQAAAPRGPGGLFGLPGLADEPPPAADEGGEGGNFIRVIPDKTKAYVGEPIAVTWYLYLTARQDKYQPLSEPRADGFWTEDIPLPNAARGLSLTQETFEGKPYLVAPLMKKALFPLQPGTLTITPLEAEISQVDFFGSSLRTQRLKAAPTIIEALPLPKQGQPADFDPASVGRLRLAAKADRDKVSVGDAVTLTVTVSGEGNLRKIPLPRLDKPEGWKSYEPKVQVALDPGDTISGTKTIEYLLLPEKAGTTMIPALTLPYFDPSSKSYVVAKSDPIRIEVISEAGSARPGGTPVGVGAGPLAPAGIENVLPAEIRPPRTRSALRRDYGTTFYRSQAFGVALATPPLVFGLTLLVGRVRERLSQETERGRRRRLRRLIRKRLRAAEVHLENHQTGPFYIEIDRVMREFLAAKLGRSVSGLSRDELSALLTGAGLSADLVQQVIDELEDCDRARFAPGDVAEPEMRSSLGRAEEIIVQLEKAKLRAEAAA